MAPSAGAGGSPEAPNVWEGYPHVWIRGVIGAPRFHLKASLPPAQQTLPPVPVQAPASPAVQTWSAPAWSASAPAYSTPVVPKTTVRAARKKRQDPLDSFTQSVVNSAGRTLGSQLTRGLLETLGLKKRRR